MNRFRTMIGIDPSGGRLAIVAVRRGVGGSSLAVPPLWHEPRIAKGPARFEEIEGVLGEFVARNRLVGAGAALVLPAESVYIARVEFPPMKERDVRDAVGMELERLFPMPPAGLRHGFRRLAGLSAGGKIPLVVVATPSEYIDRWEESVSRAGLSLSAAVPVAWAVGDALSGPGGLSGEPGRTAAVLRAAGSAVECTLFASGEPFFCASAPCSPGSALEEGLSLARAGFVDPPSSAGEGPVDLYAPVGWCGKEGKEIEDGGVVFRVCGAFDRSAASALTGAGIGESGTAPDPFPLLGAFGAALGEGRMDLLSPPRNGSDSGISRAFLGAAAIAALALGIAWPSAVAWKTKSELRRLDAQVSALRPAAERYEEALSDLDDAQERIAALREEASATGETLRILRELTDRLPNGTWLLSLRVEGRKVDIEGLSPSASEIFPALTRDGRFRAVEFGAPITRQADNIERFKIRGEFVAPPPAPASPAAGAVR
ncbi:MAG: Fimbrial assembly family protein [Deltaproteobacteria bacterium]|nr:Fimbrial assembly family protein [Deltaproteobacteria bacterium]